MFPQHVAARQAGHAFHERIPQLVPKFAIVDHDPLLHAKQDLPIQLAGCLQRRLHAFSVGDVRQRRDNPLNRTVAVKLWDGASVDPDNFAGAGPAEARHLVSNCISRGRPRPGSHRE